MKTFIAIVLVVLVLWLGAYFTWASFQALTNGDGTFTIGDFFAALWIMFIAGGVLGAARS